MEFNLFIGKLKTIILSEKMQIFFLSIILCLIYAFLKYFLSDSNFIKNPWYIIFDILANLFLAIISALALYFILQIEFIKEDIENYVVKLFTTSDFLKNLDKDRHNQFLKESLENKGCEPELAKEVINIIEVVNNQGFVIKDYEERIKLYRNNDKYIREMERSFTVNFGEVSYSLKSYLMNDFRPNKILFQHKGNERSILEFIITTRDEQHVLKGVESSEFLKEYKVSQNENSFQDKTIIEMNWDFIFQENPNIADIIVQPNEHISFQILERRIFNTFETYMATRIEYWTQGFKIRLDNQIKENYKTSFLLYGSGINEKSHHKLENQLTTDKWIHPGSGYIIVFIPNSQ